jgi:hypothetical protein
MSASFFFLIIIGQVILHDNSDPEHRIDISEQLLQDIKKMFGSGACRLIRMNSLGLVTPRAQADPNLRAKLPPPWTNIINETEIAGSQSVLTVEDAVLMTTVVSFLVKDRILPRMEERIRKLSDAIQARKGLKNQFKMWWDGGKKAPGAPPTPIPTPTPVEAVVDLATPNSSKKCVLQPNDSIPPFLVYF